MTDITHHHGKTEWRHAAALPGPHSCIEVDCAQPAVMMIELWRWNSGYRLVTRRCSIEALCHLEFGGHGYGFERAKEAGRIPADFKCDEELSEYVEVNDWEAVSARHYCQGHRWIADDIIDRGLTKEAQRDRYWLRRMRPV